MTEHPSVSAVVPTRDRPELLRAAVRAILDQDHPGPVEVVVVHDQSEPDAALAELSRPGRLVRVIRGVPAGHQPRARHSGSEGRSAPSVVSRPCPG